jgi:hypothetical protein
MMLMRFVQNLQEKVLAVMASNAHCQDPDNYSACAHTKLLGGMNMVNLITFTTLKLISLKCKTTLQYTHNQENVHLNIPVTKQNCLCIRTVILTKSVTKLSLHTLNRQETDSNVSLER